jgi:hypothetical protein
MIAHHIDSGFPELTPSYKGSDLKAEALAFFRF